MKPPPFLLGAALLFWGWQCDLVLLGALMAVALEGSRVFKSRWDFTGEDFRRVWMLCTLLFLGAAVFAFTSNEGPSAFGNLFQDANSTAQRDAALSSSRTASALFRWLPIIFYPFIAAQMFSARDTIPFTSVSVLERRRQRRAAKAGQLFVSREIFIGYPYFATCLIGASVHPAENKTFFWGVAGLLAWVLWSQRARRFPALVWLAALAAAVALGFGGQNLAGQAQRFFENLNPQWLARMMRRNFDPTRSVTAIGRIGELKQSGEIVVRVEPRFGEVPKLLREASYQMYVKQSWQTHSQRRLIDRSTGAGFPGFTIVPEEKPQPTHIWTFSASTPKPCTVNLACFLPGGVGLLPLPPGCGRVEELSAYLLHKNDLGTVLAQGPRLVVFDALCGPQSALESPPEKAADPPPSLRERVLTGALAGSPDLNVPITEQAAVDDIIIEAGLCDMPLPVVLHRLQKFFSEKFRYSTWQDAPKGPGKDQTPLSRFLLTTRRGHCEYFATATVLILRELHFYARYSTGYAVHEKAGDGYVVRERDGHAWCIVWDEDKQSWLEYDTTPPVWEAEENKQISAWQWLGDALSWLRFEIARLRQGQGNLQTYLLWIIVPALAIVIYQIVFRSGKRKKPGGPGVQFAPLLLPGLDSEFYELEKRLAALAFPRRDGEAASHWLERVLKNSSLTEIRSSLHTLLRLHYRHRFDPLGLDAAAREQLRRETRACLEQLSQSQTERS